MVRRPQLQASPETRKSLTALDHRGSHGVRGVGWRGEQVRGRWPFGGAGSPSWRRNQPHSPCPMGPGPCTWHPPPSTQEALLPVRGQILPHRSYLWCRPDKTEKDPPFQGSAKYLVPGRPKRNRIKTPIGRQEPRVSNMLTCFRAKRLPISEQLGTLRP